jgi:3-isopropylmalate dehydrogenase
MNYHSRRCAYAGTGEFMPTPDVAIMHGVITRAATERIAHAAFRLAQSRTKQVTIVHKANVLKMTTGLFRDVCREVAAQYPDVSLNDFHIDAMTVHLVRCANKFDVIVTENMFGDVLSDLAGEVAGSLGIAPSINSSDTHAMAQASHGSAPDIAGQNIANPIAMILSSAMMLRWLAAKFGDEKVLQAAELIEKAVEVTVLADTATKDLGGTACTSDFADAVTDRIVTLALRA